jgi:hypothetical protein
MDNLYFVHHPEYNIEKSHQAEGEPKMLYNEMDALSLEYKRDYGMARGNVNVSDIVNNPNSLGVVCVFGPGFSEELADLPLVKIGVALDDRADTILVL